MNKKSTIKVCLILLLLVLAVIMGISLYNCNCNSVDMHNQIDSLNKEIKSFTLESRSDYEDKCVELSTANKELHDKETIINSLNDSIKNICSQLYTATERKNNERTIIDLKNKLNEFILQQENIVQGLDSIISNRNDARYVIINTEEVEGVNSDSLQELKNNSNSFYYNLTKTKEDATSFLDDAKKFMTDINSSIRIRQEIEYANTREERDSLKRVLKKVNEELAAANDKLQNKDSEMEGLQVKIDELNITNGNLNGQIQQKNDEIKEKDKKIKDLEVALDNAKNSIPVDFRINAEKIKMKEGKDFPIPVIINKNEALHFSGETRECEIYLSIFIEEKINKTDKKNYPLPTNSTKTIYFNGKERIYHGYAKFVWDGSRKDFNISVSSNKKIKLTEDNFVYSYYIKLNGKENLFEEGKPPYKKRGRKDNK